MESLIWVGTAVTMIGLVALVWCIATVARARRQKLADAEMRERLRKIVPVNLGALLLSALGLMLVVLGIILG